MSFVTQLYRFLVRGGTAANLASVNETPLARELVLETDTGRMKRGDGTTAYNDLLYTSPGFFDMGGLADGDVPTWDAANEKFVFTAGGAGGGAFNPAEQVQIYEDFLRAVDSTTSASSSYVTTTTPMVYRNGSGGSATQNTASDAPGYLTLSTASIATGYARICTTAGNTIAFGGGEIRMRQRIRIPTLSTATQRFQVQVGFFNGISGATEALRAFYSDNTNSGMWTLETIIGGVTSSVNTSVAPTANTWQVLEIVINAAGTSAELFIDGASAATINTLPTAAMALFTYFLKTVGTTARTCDVDYHYFLQTLTTTR